MSISPPSPLPSTGITVLTLGSALTETSLTAPVIAFGDQRRLAVGQHDQPAGAFQAALHDPGRRALLGERLRRQRRGRRGSRAGPRLQLGLRGERLRLGAVESRASRHREQRGARQRDDASQRPAQSHARQVTDCSRGARHAGAFARALSTREHGARSAAPILDSPIISTYPELVTSNPNWQRPDDLGRPASASLVDPEDDLPSSNYAGDFETTAIPNYKTGSQPGFGLIGEPEPLPYAQSGDSHPMGDLRPTRRHHSRATTTVGSDDRRGTQDLGLMLLRWAVGALLVAHGLQKAFGWWGGPGLDGFEDSLTAMGFKYADMLTYIATGAQILAGVLLILGLFTPLAAAGALAYLVNGLLVEAMAAHEEARLCGLPDRRTRVQGHPGRRGRRDHPRRTGPIRARRRPRLGPSTVRRLLRRAADRHRRRHRAVGVPQRGQPAGLRCSVVRIGHSARADLGQLRQRREGHRGKQQFAAVLELRPRPRTLVEAKALDVLPAHGSLPSRLRAVTVSRSATVRSRTMHADRITGMISSGAVQVAPSTTASMPSSRKPTARCAIGDIRITTGSTGADGGCEVTPAIVPLRRAHQGI